MKYLKKEINDSLRLRESSFSGNYIDPFTENYSNYFDHLKEYNRDIHRRLETFFKKTCNEKEGFIVCFAGSDARHEKGPVSLAEFIIFHNGNKGLDNLVECKDDVEKSIVYSDLFKFVEGIEVKNLFDDSYLSKCNITNADGEFVSFLSPNRIFDSRVIYGDKEIYCALWDKFGDELKSSKAKYFLKKIKARAKDHARISLSGTQHYKGEELRHFDLDEGLAFYNRKKKQSFKQGPIRTLQFSLVRDQIKAIRGGNDFRYVPKGTVGKLNNLYVRNKLGLSQNEVSDLSDSYKYFLWLYHCSQWANKKDGTEIIGFDKVEVSERLNSLTSICKKEIITL